jgi:hypothetical protein
MIRPMEEAGHSYAQALLAWFLHQQGDTGWREAIPWVEAAMRGGYPQAAGFVVGNMLSDPDLRVDGIRLAVAAAPFGLNYADVFSQILSLAQQGDVDGAKAILAETPWPANPYSAEAWTVLLDHAQTVSDQLASLATEATGQRKRLDQHVDQVLEVARQSEQRITSQTKRLSDLITQTTNAQASSFFDSEATASETEANTTWRVGISVVAFAACLSLAPLVSHYLFLTMGKGLELSSAQTLAAHATAALALATVAGVLLTRSRVRDRNRQRNRDLSVALNTMFAYGDQIEDPAERQKFIHDLGKTVIEAYLRQEASSAEDDFRGILSVFANR